MQEIYIIMWTGRDSDSEIWGDYPCLRCGFYTDWDKACAKRDEYNKIDPSEYDEQADDSSVYWVKTIKQGE